MYYSHLKKKKKTTKTELLKVIQVFNDTERFWPWSVWLFSSMFFLPAHCPYREGWALTEMGVQCDWRMGMAQRPSMYKSLCYNYERKRGKGKDTEKKNAPERKGKGEGIIKLINSMGGRRKSGHNRKGWIEAYEVIQKMGEMNTRAPKLWCVRI